MTWGMHMPPGCLVTLTKILRAPINMLQVNFIQKSPVCHPALLRESLKGGYSLWVWLMSTQLWPSS